MPGWLILITLVVGCFGLGAFLGAPFLPILGRDGHAALDLAGLKSGETLIDLGSGDGRLLLVAAERGAYAIGYEINPLLYLWSLMRCLRHRDKIKIHLGDFWHTKLPPADVIYVFLIKRYTARLDAKLKADLKSPTRVVSYVFELPRQPLKRTRNTFLYRYP